MDNMMGMNKNRENDLFDFVFLLSLLLFFCANHKKAA